MLNHLARFALGLSATLLGALPCLAAEPKAVWAKTDVSATAMEADLSDCAAQAKSIVAHADSSVTSQSIAVYGAAGAGAGIVGEALAEVLNTPGERARAVRLCMFGRGYHAIALTRHDADELSALKSPTDTTDWVTRFYARPDFSTQLAGATPSPFPEAPAEPFVYGAVRLDPNGLKVANGVVSIGGVLLSGLASHRRTGRLLRDLPSAQYDGGGRVPAGAVLQETVFQEGDGKDRTYWCGPFKGAVESDPTCVRSDGLGYRLVPPDGSKWITTGLDLHGASGAAEPDSFWLAESADDLIGSMQFVLVLRKVTSTDIAVEAMVTKGNDTETIWLDSLPRRPDGTALVPFWSRRLVLTPQPGGVAVSFSTDGDGSGWRYVHVPN